MAAQANKIHCTALGATRIIPASLHSCIAIMRNRSECFLDTTLFSVFALLRLPALLETLASLCGPSNCFVLYNSPAAFPPQMQATPTQTLGLEGTRGSRLSICPPSTGSLAAFPLAATPLASANHNTHPQGRFANCAIVLKLRIAGGGCVGGLAYGTL